MPYPRQFISSLSTQVDEHIIEFYTAGKELYEFPPDLNELVDITLQEFLKDETGRTEIKNIHTTQLRMRRQKRSRWRNTARESVKIDITNKKNAFHYLLEQRNVISAIQFKKLYGSSDINKVIEKLLLEIDEWQAKSSSYLIDYPLISTLTKNQLYKALKNDLFINLVDIININFEGSIDTFIRRKPDALIDMPLFSPATYSIPLKESLDALTAGLFHSEDMEIEISLPKNLEEPNSDSKKFKVLDPKDNQILLCLMNNIKSDFYDSKQVMLDVGTIARELNPRPNAKHYEMVVTRLYNMSKINFIYKTRENDGTGIAFNIFDSIQIDKGPDGHRYCKATFGNVLADAIIKEKMVGVTLRNYNALELDLSKLLYHALQRERIRLSMTTPDNKSDALLCKHYDYSFFQRTVLFKQKRKDKNIALIKQTLNEFQEKGIAIHHFTVHNNNFDIYYFPLTPDEKADLFMEYNTNAAMPILDVTNETL